MGPASAKEATQGTSPYQFHLKKFNTKIQLKHQRGQGIVYSGDKLNGHGLGSFTFSQIPHSIMVVVSHSFTGKEQRKSYTSQI